MIQGAVRFGDLIRRHLVKNGVVIHMAVKYQAPVRPVVFSPLFQFPSFQSGFETYPS